MGKLLVIGGPTAVGKSDVAIVVAQKLGGEIISADSVQVYRGLDIGAAKPGEEERRAVPHHLIDIVDPRDNYTVAEFQKDAAAVIAAVHARGRLPILVGGTGLYLRAVVRGYAFSESGVDEALRAAYREMAALRGAAAVHQVLASVDHAAAAKLHPNDLRRVIRALEVHEKSRESIIDQAAKTPKVSLYDIKQFCLTMPRELLYNRIERRVDKMINDGLVGEVRQLLDSGVPAQAKSMQSLGYKQIAAYLQGEIWLEEAVSLIKRDTRRFAKRQLTWFRREPDMTWLNVHDYGTPEQIAENISCILAGNFQEAEK